ncbi:ATP-dependent DNA helicase Hrp3 [Vanrija albida]|uniref:ATP-dependent DNA helicase Hrp3 n=1 Tax=Vanrija albida TaxID=181172 RepID=A0ABR3QEY3_9TREE
MQSEESSPEPPQRRSPGDTSAAAGNSAGGSLPAPRQIILKPPRPASDDELTPEPSDDDADEEGEDEVDMDSEAPATGLASRNDSDSEQDDESEDDFDDDDGDGDDDPDFGDQPKKKAVKLPKQAAKKPPAVFPSKRPQSDSSDEDYATKSHKKKFFQRSGANSRGTATPDTTFGDSDTGSWRRGAARKVVTYNEASVDYGLDSEGDEDVMYYEKEAPLVENGTADEIDLVLSHSRDEEHASDEKDNPHTNLRFHIKWKEYSHIHNTDEMYSFLKGYKGFKKVENYIQKVWQVEQAYHHPAPDAKWKPSREDLEQYEIDRERVRELQDSYKTVERIVGERDDKRDGERTTQFLVKWTNLQYAECTWEKYDDIKDQAQEAIAAFHAREARPTVPARSASYPVHGRPAYQKIAEDPEYLHVGGALKPFQLTGLNWLAYRWSQGGHGAMLADEMGLGKTVQSVSFLSYLFHTQRQYGPFLVVVPLSTINAWQMQFQTWAPDLNVIVYMGSAASRDKIRETEFGPPKNLKFNVLLTTYEFILKDRQDLQQIKWQVLEVDEAHRLKNSDAQLYEALSSFSTGFRLLITGTPLQNNVKELLALLHFVEPEQFELANDFELGDAEQEGKIKALNSQLETLMLRRLKKDVVKELPTKSESILRVEMSGLQQHYYKNILTKNFAVLSKGGTQSVSLMNVAMELKKAANHPYLFDGAEDRNKPLHEQLRGLVMNSGKMVLLDKLLARLKADGHRVLIFSQMVRLLDIISDYMMARGYVHQRLDGTVPSDVRKKSIEHFNAPGSPDFAFLLSTRAGGLGINLETADTVIIFDSDYNPQNDLQAMARAHRIGQTRHVNIYRFVTKGTIEEDILERAKRKMILEYAIINQTDTSGGHINGTSTPKEKSGDFSKEELAAILKFGAKSMFQANEEAQNQKLDAMDLDDILTKADNFDTEATAAPAGTSSGGEAFLAQFAAIQDVKNDVDDLSWDDIIPVDERVKLDEEESRALQAEELGSRKRAAARAPGAYEGMDEADADLDTERGSKAASPTEKKAKISGPRKSNAQRAIELKDRDLRVLIRGLQKWGPIRTRYDTIVDEAKLSAKNRVVVIQTCDEILAQAEEAVAAHKAELRGMQERGEVISSSLRQKAILFAFRGIQGINAETVVARHYELKALVEHFKRVEDTDNYAIPHDNLKPTMNWSVEWGAFHDSKLLVGVWKYGFGAWDQIKADTALQLQDFIFLEDPKVVKDPSAPKAGIPGPIHLVRRGDYLCGLIREYEENRRMLIEQQAVIESMPVKEGFGYDHPPLPVPPGGSGRAAPSSAPRGGASASAAAAAAAAAAGDKGKRRKTPEYTDSEDEESYESMDEDAVKEALRPAKKHLKKLKSGTEHLSREEKIAALKECVAGIGSRIDEIVTEKTALGLDGSKWRKHCWVFASFFWPRQGVNYAKLMDIHSKLGAQGKESSPAPKKSKAKRKGDGSDVGTKKKVKVED